MRTIRRISQVASATDLARRKVHPWPWDFPPSHGGFGNGSSLGLSLKPADLRLIGLAVLLFALNAGAATLDGRVAHVVDGDTLDVVVQGNRIRVRLLDIDAPEHGQPIGHRSRQLLIALCAGEAAQVDGDKHDRNGRMLARVRCNGESGAEQVRRGMAWVFVRYAHRCMRSKLKREQRGGAYGLRLQPVPPWEWRR